MSYFIGNAIRFSKDFKTFQVKGGDNNVIPRSNSWTNSIPIEKLYYNINGGMLQFNNYNEKVQLVNYLVFNNPYGGNWENDTDYYHEYNKEIQSQKMIDFNKKFVTKLVNELKNNYSPKKNYVIKIGNRYIMQKFKFSSYMTDDSKYAQKFSKYIALNIKNKCDNFEIIKIN